MTAAAEVSAPPALTRYAHLTHRQLRLIARTSSSVSPKPRNFLLIFIHTNEQWLIAIVLSTDSSLLWRANCIILPRPATCLTHIYHP